MCWALGPQNRYLRCFTIHACAADVEFAMMTRSEFDLQLQGLAIEAPTELQHVGSRAGRFCGFQENSDSEVVH